MDRAGIEWTNAWLEPQQIKKISDAYWKFKDAESFSKIINNKFKRKKVQKYDTLSNKIITKTKFIYENTSKVRGLSGFIKRRHSLPKFNNNTAKYFIRLFVVIPYSETF